MSGDAAPPPEGGAQLPSPEPGETPGSGRRPGDPANLVWAADVMRRNTRRSWLVPLLAVPIAQIAVEPELPASFLAVDPVELAVGRETGAAVLQATERVVASPDADLSDEEALDVLFLALEYRPLLCQVFGFKPPIEELLALPPGLSGAALVRRLAQCVGERPEPPGRLAVSVASLLDDRVTFERDYLPVPDPSFVDLSRAFDRRCYALGFRGWADALRHAAAVWSPQTWRGALMAYSAGGLKSLVLNLFQEAAEPRGAPAVPVSPFPNRRGKRRALREDPELARLRGELAAAKRDGDSARADAAAARRREEELVQGRNRAQRRAEEMTARSREVEAELEKARRELRATLATLRRLQGLSIPEEPLPAPVAPPPLPDDLLRGRPVFLFTGQERAVAARLQAEALRPLGGEDVRLYDVRQGRPGPDVFPAGSVVVVDTRFVGHAHTDEIEARIRRSPPDVVYLPLRAGEGGLAARLAERLMR